MGCIIVFSKKKSIVRDSYRKDDTVILEFDRHIFARSISIISNIQNYWRFWFSFMEHFTKILVPFLSFWFVNRSIYFSNVTIQRFFHFITVILISFFLQWVLSSKLFVPIDNVSRDVRNTWFSLDDLKLHRPVHFYEKNIIMIFIIDYFGLRSVKSDNIFYNMISIHDVQFEIIIIITLFIDGFWKTWFQNSFESFLSSYYLLFTDNPTTVIISG